MKPYHCLFLQAVDARKLEKSWRQRAEMAESALEQARIDTADIRADMARQHNSTQVRAVSAAVVQIVQTVYSCRAAVRVVDCCSSIPGSVLLLCSCAAVVLLQWLYSYISSCCNAAAAAAAVQTAYCCSSHRTIIPLRQLSNCYGSVREHID
jgi:hypothetical protein